MYYTYPSPVNSHKIKSNHVTFQVQNNLTKATIRQRNNRVLIILNLARFTQDFCYHGHGTKLRGEQNAWTRFVLVRLQGQVRPTFLCLADEVTALLKSI